MPFLGLGVAPTNYPTGLQGIGAEFREVVNILGERNRVGTLTGTGASPVIPDPINDAENEDAPKRPPRPLYRRFFSYVRHAWTGVKFALGNLTLYIVLV